MIAVLLSLGAPGLASCGGDSGGPPTASANAPRAAAPRPPESSASGRLRLSNRGHPVVWVKRHESVALRARPGGEVVKRLGPRTEFGSPTVLAVLERRGRWAGVPAPSLPNGRLGWVRLDPSRLRSGWTRYAVDVDLSRHRAQLLLGNRALRSFAVTVGAPASPTPTGRFAVTDTFRGNLNPVYGCCALAITATQPSLPSGWLGGNRIAIHGTQGELGVSASHGCVRAANADVSALVRRVPLGSPVVIHG